MKKILITGAMGQLGSELTTYLREIYGNTSVIATDVFSPEKDSILLEGPFEKLDVLDAKKVMEITKKENIDTIIHLAALLSAKAEENPHQAWNVNMNGLLNTLEAARVFDTKFFTPSSIGAFGPETPKKNTPQITIQRPNTIYGVSKASGELLCDYYFKRFGVDTRGLRYPGLIGYVTEPGGGTTDYAVDIFYEAVKNEKYECYIKKGTFMDMMYMPDALKAVVDLMEADPSKLKDRNAFNVSSMSLEPGILALEIKKHIKAFKMTYKADKIRQEIADSWPDNIDYSEAKKQWGFKTDYNLESMVKDMIEKIRLKLNITS